MLHLHASKLLNQHLYLTVGDTDVQNQLSPVHLDANGYLGVRRTDLYSQKLVNETLHVSD